MSGRLRIAVVFFAFVCGLSFGWEKEFLEKNKEPPPCTEGHLLGRSIAGFYRGRFFYFKVEKWADFKLDLDLQELFGDAAKAENKDRVRPTHLLPFSRGRIALFFHYQGKFHVSYRNLTGKLPNGKWRLHDLLTFRRTFKDKYLDFLNSDVTWNWVDSPGDVELRHGPKKEKFERIHRELDNDQVGAERRRAIRGKDYTLNSTIGNFRTRSYPYERLFIWNSFGADDCVFAMTDTSDSNFDLEQLQVLPWHFKVPDEEAPGEEVDANPHTEEEIDELFLPLPVEEVTTSPEPAATTTEGSGITVIVISSVSAVLGVVVAVGIGVGVFFFVRRRKKQQEKKGKNDPEAVSLLSASKDAAATTKKDPGPCPSSTTTKTVETVEGTEAKPSPAVSAATKSTDSNSTDKKPPDGKKSAAKKKSSGKKE